jgi:hypothetical protein
VIEAPSSGVDLERLLPDLTIELLAHTWDLAKAIGVRQSVGRYLRTATMTLSDGIGPVITMS